MTLHSEIDRDNDNVIFYGDNITLNVNIDGKHNRVKIGEGRSGKKFHSTMSLHIFGDNNTVRIANNYVIRGLSVSIGDQVYINNAMLSIGANFTCVAPCNFYLSNPAVKLTIGNDCMFSNHIRIRCGELSHLIFDRTTGEYLDVCEGVHIGNHVWIGTTAFIAKRAVIPDGCVVGACSVVTRKFDRENCVIAGNPARIARENIEWFVSRQHIPDDSPYAASFDKIFAERMNLPE